MSSAGERQPRVLDHEYDGIQEYDNPQPAYWTWIFLGSTVWAIGYLLYYHVGPGKSETEDYAAAWATYDKERSIVEEKEAAAVTESVLADKAKDAGQLALGRDVFARTCTSCHGNEGEGLIGPNLTDGQQVHGTSRVDLYVSVRKGIPDKGMRAWGRFLSPEDLVAVSAYVVSLRHTNKTGRQPEGANVEPFAP